MSCPGQNDFIPTDVGEPRTRGAVTPAGKMAPISLEEVMATAHRVAQASNKSYAATNVSVREVIGMAELLVTTEAALRRKLLKEPACAEAPADKGD